MPPMRTGQGNTQPGSKKKKIVGLAHRTKRERYDRFWRSGYLKPSVGGWISPDAIFRNIFRRTKITALPKCHICWMGNKTGPKEPVTGAEKEHLVPCGCPWKEAILEQWLVLKGLLKSKQSKSKDVPQTLGRARATFVMMFEAMFGQVTASKLLNTDMDSWSDWLRGNLKFPDELVEDEDVDNIDTDNNNNNNDDDDDDDGEGGGDATGPQVIGVWTAADVETRTSAGPNIVAAHPASLEDFVHRYNSSRK